MKIFILLLVFTTAALAEGMLYTGTTKQVNCIDPTKREGGEELTIDEIERTLIGYSQERILTVAPKIYSTMKGGCSPITFTLTSLPSEGQWYQFAWTIACDVPMINGVCPAGKSKYSKPSVAFPFIYQAEIITKTRPEAAVPIE